MAVFFPPSESPLDAARVDLASETPGLESLLGAHPKIWPEGLTVRLKELGVSSLDVEVTAWFQTQNWSEFQLIRQEILLQFMNVVAEARSSLALPTRTVHLVGEPLTVTRPADLPTSRRDIPTDHPR